MWVRLSALRLMRCAVIASKTKDGPQARRLLALAGTTALYAPFDACWLDIHSACDRADRRQCRGGRPNAARWLRRAARLAVDVPARGASDSPIWRVPFVHVP